LKKQRRRFLFAKTHSSITEVLTDHGLASLGDAFVNLVYSLALSDRKGKPSGAKVKGEVLAEALRKARLRENLPSRMTRHAMADAVEALVVYAWLHSYITIEENVAALEKTDDSIEGFGQLLAVIKNRVKFS
jgi:hypothetical protein